VDLAQFSTEVVTGVYLAGPPEPIRYRTSLENPNLPLNDPQVWADVFGDSFGTDTGIAVTAEKALMYAPFYRAVQLISGDVAKLPRPVYKRRTDLAEDAREKDRGHRLNYVLNVAANEETEAIKFWCRFMSHALIWSNAYAYIERDGTGSPAALYNLLPDRTHCEYIDGRKFYITEVSGDRGARLQALLPEDVLHIEGLNITNGSAAYLFRLARNSIALGLAQEKFASKFFANGGRVGGILELPMGMPKPARDAAEEGFRRTYEGADNPFKTVVLRDSAKFHAAQMSPRDSQMVEGTEAQTRAIAHWFNLPPSKLGLSDSVSYNSKAEDNQNYLDTTLQIWLTRIESACNFRLLSVRQADTHFVEHNVKNLLRMNPLQQAQVHQIQVAARIRNPNECRSDLNLLPYEGGEEYVNPNTMKSGNEPGEEPKDDKPKEEDKPKRDAAYLRVLFGITARARDKAKRPQAFLEWIDGNLQPHRDEWRRMWADKQFPFAALAARFKAAAEHYPADKLPEAIEAICTQSEESDTWNAE
jgi:HK97 family phage portal protein